jgi:hypothetical protein
MRSSVTSLKTRWPSPLRRGVGLAREGARYQPLIPVTRAVAAVRPTRRTCLADVAEAEVVDLRLRTLDGGRCRGIDPDDLPSGRVDTDLQPG